MVCDDRDVSCLVDISAGFGRNEEEEEPDGMVGWALDTAVGRSVEGGRRGLLSCLLPFGRGLLLVVVLGLAESLDGFFRMTLMGGS